MEGKGKGREDSSFQCDWFQPYGFASVTAGIPPNVYGISITSFLLHTFFLVKGFKFRYSIEVCAPDVSIQHVVKFLQPGFRLGSSHANPNRERDRSANSPKVANSCHISSVVQLLVHLCPRCFDRHSAGGLCALVAAQLDVPVAAAAAALRHRLGVLHQHQPTPGREGMRGPVAAMVFMCVKRYQKYLKVLVFSDGFPFLWFFLF